MDPPAGLHLSFLRQVVFKTPPQPTWLRQKFASAGSYAVRTTNRSAKRGDVIAITKKVDFFKENENG